MDNHYLNIACDELHKAEGYLLMAQHYLLKAGVSDRVITRERRYIGGVRNLMDVLKHLEQSNREVVNERLAR